MMAFLTKILTEQFSNNWTKDKQKMELGNVEHMIIIEYGNIITITSLWLRHFNISDDFK